MGWRAAGAILAKDLKLELRRVETLVTMVVFAVYRVALGLVLVALLAAGAVSAT